MQEQHGISIHRGTVCLDNIFQESRFNNRIDPQITVQYRNNGNDAAVNADGGQLRRLFDNLYSFAQQSLDCGGGMIDIEVRNCSGCVPGSHRSLFPAGPSVRTRIEIRRHTPEQHRAALLQGMRSSACDIITTMAAIVRELAGNMHCEIYCSGIRFIIWLPRTNALHQELFETSGQRRRILIVDDDKNIGKLYARKLEREGHRPVFAESGRSALELFRAAPESFDLIVTDVMMPGMTGVRFMEKILSIRPDIPFIVSSGHLGIDVKKNRSFLSKADAYLEKPCNLDRFAEAVRESLHKRKRAGTV